MFTNICVKPNTDVRVRNQPAGVSSLQPPSESRQWNPGHQTPTVLTRWDIAPALNTQLLGNTLPQRHRGMMRNDMVTSGASACEETRLSVWARLRAWLALFVYSVSLSLFLCFQGTDSADKLAFYLTFFFSQKRTSLHMFSMDQNFVREKVWIPS